MSDPNAAYTKDRPYHALVKEVTRLSGQTSEKDTRHIVIDIDGSGLSYKCGDALGVYPSNCQDIVSEFLAITGADPNLQIASVAPGAAPGSTVALTEAIAHERTVTKPGRRALELLAASAADDTDKTFFAEFLKPGGLDEGTELLDLLIKHPSARPDVKTLVETLPPLKPRLYSIASSPAAHGSEVHLTVAAVRYTNSHGRSVKGVASTFLADRIPAGEKAKVYFHAAPKFGLPADPNADIIMVGPGTGIAPFRSFIHERKATGAKGRNWLFFGDQRRATDFLYEQEFAELQSQGVLTKFDVAFSRDQAHKVYVQNKMTDNAAELWQWISNGAYFYVCGDAKRMAKDVDNALKQIAQQQGNMDEVAAKAFVQKMTKDGRYQRDVY